ncbi:outer membrane scaffolding protein for murein synthesis (MipA/OmpV family) [Xanthomonas translucens]|uniref:MipA/OmpV family protein n=1 Tax=Stenotrophomonas maltophilia TaxID=40324 RepID=UPI0013116645|nr:MipA/OmpV family protein [Stenotrophomonas maltophilia]MDT3430806.1 MipA/OmpV family protein [Stenotrophomonas maltophilia]
MSSHLQWATRLRRQPSYAALPILVAGIFSTPIVSAQTADTKKSSMGQAIEDAERSESRWGIGVAGGMQYRVYRDFDDRVRGLPMITYENRWIQVAGPGLDVKLPSVGPVSFRLRGRYAAMEEFDSGDSPYFAGMRDREASFWIGGAAIWRAGFANLSAELLTDAMSNSKGTRATLQIDRRFTAGSIGLTPRLAAEWVDSKYVDYYYGVRSDEAQSWRPAYGGSSSVNTEIGLRVDWQPVPKHTVFLDMGAKRMGSSIRDSPLVEKSTQYGVGLGYLYRF